MNSGGLLGLSGSQLVLVSPLASERRAALPMSERPDRRRRLLRRADFQACYKQGRRCGGNYTTLFVLPNELETPRYGITATRKIGNAVARQKAKRRIREIVRRWPERDRMPALDVVFHLKHAIVGAEFSLLEKDVVRQLGEVAGLIPRRRRGPGPDPGAAQRNAKGRP